MKILVLSDEEFHSRWVTSSLASAGHRVTYMAPGIHRLVRMSRHCQASAVCDAKDLRGHRQSLLRWIEVYCQRHRVDWVVPADFHSILFLAEGRGELKGVGVFPLPEPALIERLHDKWEFSKLLQKEGLPSPRTRLLESRDQARTLPLDFPLMIKPLRGEGGVGVQRMNSRAELSAFLDSSGERVGWPCLVQDYVPGRDIDLSALADHGRVVAWTIQQRPLETPEVVEFLHHPRVLEIGSALIAACRYHGVVHLDMRIDERTNEPVLIEANPRFWGSLRHSVWSGVNFPALGIAMARGEDPGQHFAPVTGPCRDPGLSLRPFLGALLRGKRRPEGWSFATEVGWRSHLADPIPELWHRLNGLNRDLGKAWQSCCAGVPPGGA